MPMGKPGSAWSHLADADLLKFAYAIKLPTDEVSSQKIERLSLPSPWARLLLFEHAILYGDFHPARAQVLGEWRGLLGLIGLSQLLGATSGKSQLTASTVELAGSELSVMRPGGWPTAAHDAITLLYWDGKLVGGSSPMTMAFTGRRIIDPSVEIPFIVDGRFTDPLSYYVAQFDHPSSDEDARRTVRVLHAWVRRTWENVRDDASLEASLGKLAGEGGSLSRRSRLQDELYRWVKECESALGGEAAAKESAAELRLSENVQIFHRPFDFLRPVQWTERERPHPLGLMGSPHIVVNPLGGKLLDRNKNSLSATLPIRGALTLAVHDGIVATRVDRTLGEKEQILGVSELFEPRLIRIDATDAEIDLRFAHLLIAGGGRYFYPVKPEVAAAGLDEAVLSGVSAEERKDRGPVVVRIELRVQGGRVVRFEKEYPRTTHIEEVVPSELWIWPDFESDRWKSYFWANAIPQSETLNVARFSPIVSDGRLAGEYRPNGAEGTRWGISDRPLRYWAVTASHGDARGLLRVQPREKSGPDSDTLVGGKWRVAIDLGSTHTLAYVRIENARVAEQLPLRDRSVRVVGSGKDIEFNFFTFRAEAGAPIGAPTLLWTPIDKLVDPNGAKHVHDRWIPGFGHVFYGTEVKGKRWGSLFANLKWRPLAAGEEQRQSQIAFKNYLSHLCLMIAAEAAWHDAELERVFGSYPGVFDFNRQEDYATTLRAAVRAVNPSQGGASDQGAGEEVDEFGERRVRSVHRVDVELLCDEATALESYLREKKGAVTDFGLIAVDIGGSTSDFVVLRAGETSRRYTSIQFAGGLVNRIIGADDRTAAVVQTALQSDHVGLNERDAVRVMRLLSSPENRTVGAGLLLRTLGADRKAMLFAKALFSAGDDGRRILAAIAYLFATNAFFMGLLASPMEEGRDESGYLLYFAGRGALLRDWLNALRPVRPGASSSAVVEDLVAHFFLAGVNAAATVRGEATVVCSVTAVFPSADEAKREVAIGLLSLSKYPDLQQQAQSGDRSHSNPIGEVGFFSSAGVEYPWSEPLTAAMLLELRSPGLKFSAEGLRIFSTFVAAFSTLNLRIQGLDFSRLLQLSPQTLKDARLKALLFSHLFGDGSSWKRISNDPQSADGTTYEPFFISAAKGMLEFGLGVGSLF